MGWFDEQIRQRIEHDDDMFADAFAQMANLVSSNRVVSGLSNDRKLAEEAIGDILRYYHVRAQEVPEQLTDVLVVFDDQNLFIVHVGSSPFFLSVRMGACPIHLIIHPAVREKMKDL